MKFFNKDIKFGNILPSTRKINELQKQVDDLTDTALGRPLQDMYGGRRGGLYIPYFPMQLRALYNIAFFSDTMRTIFNALRTELFRRGITIKPRFAGKCVKCEVEYDQIPEEKTCNCGGELREPDPKQKDLLYEFKERCNENEQEFIDVLELFEDDLNIADDGYILFRKRYAFQNNEIINSEVKEALRVYPLIIEIMADRAGRLGMNSEGQPIYVCPVHRSVELKEPVCQCGLKAYPAYYKAKEEDQEDVYYIEGEIIHQSKYHKSLTYGFPPMLACWQKFMTLMEEDKYIYDYYSKKRPPRGLLFLRVFNRDSFKKAYNWAMDEFKKNPHRVPPIPIENPRLDGKGSTGNIAEFVDFMRNLEEMQFIEQRNEYRKVIGGLYGVMPIYQADISQTGGLNNEGMQIAVTNRAIEKGQRIYNDKVLVKTSKILGVTDWVMELEPVEVKDAQSELAVEGLKIKNAGEMAKLGLKVRYNDSGEFEVDEGDVEAPKEEFDRNNLFGSPTGSMNMKPQRFSGEPEKSLHDVADLMEIEKGEIERDEGESFVIKESSVDMAKELIKNLFSGKFEGLTTKDSNIIRAILINGLIKKKGMKDIMNDMVGETGISKEQAETILRTERQAVTTKMREFYYEKLDKEKDFKYKWIGPVDHRTTGICKRIKKRTSKGVTLDKLKKIVNEEGEKEGFITREFVPHINCRHTFVRKR